MSFNSSLEDALNEEMLDLIDGKVTIEQTSLCPPQTNKKQVEFVLLYGPPLSGKSFYSKQHYENTHIRISPSELFKQDENFSFHRLTALVTEHLIQNKSVVIDDENRLPRTRMSYLKAIKEAQNKKKLENLRLLAVCFQPLGGINQCLWANEWEYAEHLTSSDSKEKQFQPKSSSEFEEWFHGDNHPPTKQEGFDEILSVRTKIHCNHTEKLATEALFIDAAAIFQFEKKETKNTTSETAEQRELKLITRTPQETRLCYEKAFQQFKENHTKSVIVVLLDESAFYPMILQVESSIEKQQQMVAAWRKQFRNYLENWATMIQMPVSYVIAEYASLEPGSFFSLPNHGMISYAQYVHQINLRKSFFISDKNTKTSLGFSCGFHNVISAFDFFADSGWDMKSKLRKFSFDYSVNYTDFLDVVLYPHVTRPDDMFENSGEFHSGLGRLHGTCVPSVSLSDLCFSDEELDMDVDSELSLPRPVSIETGSQPNKSSSEPTASSINTNCASAPQQRVPALSEAYIRSIVTPVNFDRGMQYYKYDTIFNRRRKGFELSGMCKGSSAPPYEIVVNLSTRAEKIRSSYCTCPIRTGKCKHVAAFLLSWVLQKEKFKTKSLQDASEIPPSPVPPTPHQLKTNQTTKTPEKQPETQKKSEPKPDTVDKSEFMSSKPTSNKRKLPAWMNKKDQSPTKKAKTSTKRKTQKDSAPQVKPEQHTSPKSTAPHVCETLHISPNNAPVPAAKKNQPVRSVKEILADLDKELESVPDSLIDSEDEDDEPVAQSPPKARVSLKDRLAAAGLHV